MIGKILLLLLGLLTASLSFAQQSSVLTKIQQTGSSPEGMAVNPVTHKAYIVSEDATVGKAVQVFDSGVLTKVIPIINESEYITIDPTRNLIYVSTKYGYRDAENGDEAETGDDEATEPADPPQGAILAIGTLTVIDGTTDSVIASWSFPDGVQPEGVAVDTINNVVYVAAKAPEGEAADNSTCTSGVPIPDVAEPGDVECWTGGYIYAFSVDVANKTIAKLKMIPAGDDPEALVFVDGKVYAANEDDGTVTIASAVNLNGTGGDLLTDVPVPPTQPYSAGVAPYSLGVFYPYGPNPLACIENKFEADKMAVGGGSAFITDDRSRVAKITGINVVGMWDVPGASICEEIPNSDGGGANSANKIAFMQRDSCQLLYVVSEQNTVAVYDPQSMYLKETITIPEALHLDAVGVDDTANRVWITDEDLPAAFVLQGACATGVARGTPNSQELTTDQESPVAITLTAYGDVMSFLVGAPAHGTLTGVAPNLVYTPNPGYYGPDSFPFRVNDGAVDSPEALVSITIHQVFVPITVNTVPAGHSFAVDGLVYTGEQTFSWGLGTGHTLAVMSPQAGGSGTQYAFANWSDNGARSHVIKASAGTPIYTASFTTQYLLTTSASPTAGGTVSPSTGFYDADAVVNVSVTPNEGYTFSKWSGDLTETNNSATLIMSAPRTITAEFSDLIPVVTVLAPNGGEKLFTTSPYTIRWNAKDVAADLTFTVSFSSNGGTSFAQVPGCSGGLSSTTRSCVWSAPGPVTSNGRVRVDVIRAGNILASDVSDAAVVVSSATPTITVSIPNTALTWAIGTVKTIKWTHNLGLNSSVNVDISRDSGGTWTPLAAGVKSATATTGLYDWTVSGPPTAAALVRVSWADGTAGDVSNVTFSIAEPVVTVTIPNTNVNWAIGSVREIRWTHNLGANTRYKIELTRDAGASWEVLNPEFASTTATVGSWDWTVTGPVTAAAQLRVSWLDGPVSDISNVTFRIAEPRVTVTAPNATVTWDSGTTQTISWTHNLGTNTHYKIELTRDGTNWEVLNPDVLSTTAAAGSWDWMVTGPATATAKVRVSWLGGAATDTSNVNFQIAVPVMITVNTVPAGRDFSVDGVAYAGEQTFSWGVGTVHTLDVTSEQTSGTDTRYVFANWSDGGSTAHAVTVSDATTYTANFETQYQLTTSALPTCGGTVTPASGFYPAGAVVNLQATAGGGYTFQNWTGPVAASGSAATTVTMTGPVSVRANLATSQTINLVVTASLTRLSDGSYQAAGTITNRGMATAQNVTLTTALLGSANGTPAPQAVGAIAPCSSAPITMAFPNTAGTPGTATVQRYFGNFNGGNFSTSLRVLLPK